MSGASTSPVPVTTDQEAAALVDIARLERLFTLCDEHGESILGWTPFAGSASGAVEHVAYLKRLDGLNRKDGVY